MIYPDVETKKWAEIHKITLVPEKCEKCSNPINLTKARPVAFYVNGVSERGVIIGICGKCGFNDERARCQF